MSAPNDGGSAFPHPGYHGVDGKFVDVPHQGMTLRDWFAGQALAGLLNDVGHIAQVDFMDGSDRSLIESASHYAYEIADAMLVERTVEEVTP